MLNLARGARPDRRPVRARPTPPSSARTTCPAGSTTSARSTWGLGWLPLRSPPSAARRSRCGATGGAALLLVAFPRRSSTSSSAARGASSAAGCCRLPGAVRARRATASSRWPTRVAARAAPRGRARRGLAALAVRAGAARERPRRRRARPHGHARAGAALDRRERAAAARRIVVEPFVPGVLARRRSSARAVSRSSGPFQAYEKRLRARRSTATAPRLLLGRGREPPEGARPEGRPAQRAQLLRARSTRRARATRHVLALRARRRPGALLLRQLFNYQPARLRAARARGRDPPPARLHAAAVRLSRPAHVRDRSQHAADAAARPRAAAAPARGSRPWAGPADLRAARARRRSSSLAVFLVWQTYPELRHVLHARLGPGAGQRPPARLRRLPHADAASARRRSSAGRSRRSARRATASSCSPRCSGCSASTSSSTCFTERLLGRLIALIAVAVMLTRTDMQLLALRAMFDLPVLPDGLRRRVLELRRAALRLAGARAARARRPAAPGGMAARRRLLALARARHAAPDVLLRYALLVAAAPLLWLASDLIVPASRSTR